MISIIKNIFSGVPGSDGSLPPREDKVADEVPRGVHGLSSNPSRTSGYIFDLNLRNKLMNIKK